MEQVHLGLLIVSAFVGWTVSVVGATFWLASKFRALEVMFFKALNTHKEEDAETFEENRLRIQRIEMKVFGFTRAP